VRAGHFILIIDNESLENTDDLVIAAEMATPKARPLGRR
jgi:3,4-dihydroxy-2-butanone 4-phosphate synthase